MMNLQSPDINFLETMGGGLWEAYKVCGVVASVTCLLYGILQSLWKVFVWTIDGTAEPYRGTVVSTMEYNSTF